MRCLAPSWPTQRPGPRLMPADLAGRRIRSSIAPTAAIAAKPISPPPSRLPYSALTSLEYPPAGPLQLTLATFRAECLLNGCVGEAFSIIGVSRCPLPYLPASGEGSEGAWCQQGSDQSVMLDSPVNAAVRSVSRRGTMPALVRMALVLPMLAFVAGCSTWSLFGSDKDEVLPDEPADKLYNEGVYLLNEKHDSKGAAKKFEEVDRQHPYSEWARKSLLMSAYSYYEARNYDESISSAKRYISLHPGTPDA